MTTTSHHRDTLNRIAADIARLGRAELVRETIDQARIRAVELAHAGLWDEARFVAAQVRAMEAQQEG
jgi:hypothetical protein